MQNTREPRASVTRRRHRLPAICVALLCAWTSSAVAGSATVDIQWFEYRGRDAVFETPLPEAHYRNPVLSGFHPDPGLIRARDRFYLVLSTFAWFPGIPVYESVDLVHWNQIGNAIERPDQLDYAGLGVSRGVFAPTINYHDGLFYVLNTAVDNGGNFVVTARDPAGPWSDPVWFPAVDGIDPSLFFDHDGQVYLLNNGPPQGTPRYDGHRAIWMQAFDRERLQPVGPRRILIDGGVDPSANPIWIEGPHIYRRNGWYYLVCAEGGTGPQHSQVVLRSRDVWGPYVPYEHNPILTQRDLDPARPHPVTNAGHADLVEGPDGQWWATFLASRTFGGGHYVTGRETFLLPVTWENDWPHILDPGRPIPRHAPMPGFAADRGPQAPATGNFVWRDDFDAPTLGMAWLALRAPASGFSDLAARPGTLQLHPRADDLDGSGRPAFVARRVQHQRYDATMQLHVPGSEAVDAGLVVFQNERHWFFLGLRRDADGAEIFLERSAADERTVVARQRIGSAFPLRLRIVADEAEYRFAFALEGAAWQSVGTVQDGTVLSTSVAGGFVGAMLGPFARCRDCGAATPMPGSATPHSPEDSP